MDEKIQAWASREKASTADRRGHTRRCGAPRRGSQDDDSDTAGETQVAIMLTDGQAGRGVGLTLDDRFRSLRH
jgi:hypothetical protein